MGSIPFKFFGLFWHGETSTVLNSHNMSPRLKSRSVLRKHNTDLDRLQEHKVVTAGNYENISVSKEAAIRVGWLVLMGIIIVDRPTDPPTDRPTNQPTN